MEDNHRRRLLVFQISPNRYFNRLRLVVYNSHLKTTRAVVGVPTRNSMPMWMISFCQIFSQDNLDNDNLIGSNWQTNFPIYICWMKHTPIVHSAGEARAICNVTKFDTARGETWPILKPSYSHVSAKKASPDIPDASYKMFVSNTISSGITRPSNF